MEKVKVIQIIEKFRNEISGNSDKIEIVDPWFVNNNKTEVPVYKKLSIGYNVKNEGDYEIILKTFSKNRKTNRLALEILNRIGDGRIERLFSGKSKPSFLIGKKNYKKEQFVTLGSSVSNQFNSYGTIGGFVKTKENKLAILTCAHVLKDSSQTTVYSPAPKKNSNHKKIHRQVGIIHKHHLPSSVYKTNYIDASSTILFENIPIKPNIITYTCKFKGKIIKPIQNDKERIDRGELIYKLGAKISYKVGSYVGLHDVEIDGISFSELHTVNDKIGSFAKPGDSGSLGFIEQNGSLFGLGLVVGYAYVAGYRKSYIKQTYICPINRILDDLEVSFI